MNAFLNDIMSVLDEDTLFVVMGDHGMTASGDHGGASNLEVNAGIYMRGKGLPTRSFKKRTSELAFRQVDLVPTLSLLLGIPIPFSNVGKVSYFLGRAMPPCFSN